MVKGIDIGDSCKFSLLAERFQQAMATAVHQEPIRLRPGEVGISPLNRQFSIQHVHSTILSSFIRDGHDPNRTQVGICREVRDPQKRLHLENHNKALAANSPLMPSVRDNAISYEGLSTTHYNVALRLVDECRVSSAGDLAAAKVRQESLANAAHHGHKWIVLPESTTDETAKEICAWRNQDQNENMALADGEFVRMASVAVRQFLASNGAASSSSMVNMPLSLIVQSALRQTTVKVQPAIMGPFCRFVCQLAQEGKLDLVDEYLAWWSAAVDPQQIAVPHTHSSIGWQSASPWRIWPDSAWQ